MVGRDDRLLTRVDEENGVGRKEGWEKGDDLSSNYKEKVIKET